MSALVVATTLAKAAAPIVNWGGLFKVLALAIGTGVIIVGGFSLGIAALDVYVWSLRQQNPEVEVFPGRTGEVTLERPSVRYASLAVALFFFAVCVAGVVVGLVEMLSK
jgi:hypothetical protein